MFGAQVAVQEVRRLQQFGVTKGEMERYKAALLRDSDQMASQADSVASVDTLNFLMEYLALGHTVMHAKQVRPSVRPASCFASMAHWHLGHAVRGHEAVFT